MSLITKFWSRLCRVANAFENSEEGYKELLVHFNDAKKSARRASNLLDKNIDLTKKIIASEKEKTRLYKLMLDIGDATPDMIWAKDLEGNYVYANKKIREGLIFAGCGEDTTDKNDIFFANRARKRFGDDNHTFGALCGSSDDVVLAEQRPIKFYEYGLSGGKMLKLVVYKNVQRDDSGEVIGTVGVGRDVTEEFNELEEIALDCKCKHTRSRLLGYINKHEFTLNSSEVCNASRRN